MIFGINWIFGDYALRVVNVSKDQIMSTAVILVLVAGFIMIALIFFFSSNGGVIPIPQDEAAILTDGWTCSWEDIHDTFTLSLPTKVPGGYAGRTLHLSNTLPARHFHDPSLMIRTSEQEVHVYLNGTLLYQFLSEDPQRAPGSMYHLIHLPEGYEGGRLDILLSSPLRQFSGVANDVRLGSITSHILYILKQGGMSLILAVVVLMLGLILIAFFFAMYSTGSKHPGIIYLALFAILSGIWMGCESRALELFIRNPRFIMCLAFMSQYLAPIPILAFVIDMFRPKYAHWLKRFIHIFAAYFFMVSTLYLLSRIEFYDTAIVFHSLLACCIFVLIMNACSEIRRGSKSSRLFFLGCVLLCLSICIDIMRYYFLSLPWIMKPAVYPYGLLVFIMTTIGALAQHIFMSREEKISHDILMSLAFTDTLTGFKNRRAFDERVAAINKELDTYSSIHLAIMDINGLKQVNDTLGHMKGDELIMEGARLIRDTLGHLGEIFRIGGDEFVMLATNIEPYFIEVELDTLEKRAAAFNENAASFKISIAYGLDSYNRDQDKDLHDVFVRADKSMYICKEKQKGLHYPFSWPSHIKR